MTIVSKFLNETGKNFFGGVEIQGLTSNFYLCLSFSLHGVHTFEPPPKK